MTAGEYYDTHVVDGRAVLAWCGPWRFQESQDPACWLCRLKGPHAEALVICDAEGPTEDGIDDGFLMAISEDLPVEETHLLWRQHRNAINAKKRADAREALRLRDLLDSVC